MGQIKNIKLHIVTDIKVVVLQNTQLKQGSVEQANQQNNHNEHACRTPIPTKVEPRPPKHQLVERQNKVRLHNAHQDGLERRQRVGTQPVRKRESHQGQQTGQQCGGGVEEIP